MHRTDESVEYSLTLSYAHKVYFSAIGCIGFSRNGIESQEQLSDTCCTEIICMLHATININTKKKEEGNCYLDFGTH